MYRRQVTGSLAWVFALAVASNAGAAPPAPLPLDIYGDLPAVEDLAIPPGGDGLAFFGKIRGERLLVVAGPDNKAAFTARIGEAKVRSIAWAGDKFLVTTISATQKLGMDFTTSKHEFYGAMVLSVDDQKTFSVFEGRQKMGQAIFGSYGTRLIDGKWTGFFGGVELENGGRGAGYYLSNANPALFQVDLASGSFRKVAPAAPDGHSREWLVDAQGRVVATFDIESREGQWRITNGDGRVIAGGTDPMGDSGLLGLGRSAATIIYATRNAGSEQVDWYEVPLSGGASAEFLPGIDVRQLYKDRATGTLVGYEIDGAVPTPVFFDPKHQAALKGVYRAFPKLSVSVVDWTPDFGRMLVLTRGNGDSGTYYSVNLKQLRADPVGYERPLINPEHVGAISLVEYKASDGLDLDGVLTLPPGRAAKNLPVVVFPHGGPASHDEVTFDWWAQAFASRGYAVFQPNFRGSTNRNEAFEHAGYGEWGRKMQTDVSDGLAHLARLGIVDERRACIMGASYGGYAALAGVTLQRGLYRCAVAVAPVSDLKLRYDYWIRATNSDKTTKRNMLGMMGDPARYDAVSPRQHAAKADAPILLIHGKDDTVVEYRHSTAMADALKSAGKPHEFITLGAEDHWLSRPETRKQMLTEAMRFVTKYNPPDEIRSGPD